VDIPPELATLNRKRNGVRPTMDADELGE